MKINKRSIRKSALAAAVTVLIGMVSSCADLWSEQHPGTFYISDGKTVATFLEQYPEDVFSDFITVLKRANLWEDLKTYGDRTVFAPTNDAIKEYLNERRAAEKDTAKKYYFDNVENLPDSIIDTLARTHICETSVYLKDFNKGTDGTISAPNMLDRYLSYQAIADSISPEQTIVSYVINQFSKIVEPDDSTVNGVVQVINSVIRQSNLFIPGYLNANNISSQTLPSHKAKIFYDALMLTHLSDTLEKYKDKKYPEPEYDSTYTCLKQTEQVAVWFETGNEKVSNGQQQRVVWPEERLFKFTLFVVTDSILEHVYNIKSVDDLIAKAKEVYDDPAHINDDHSLITSPLYKLMSYHILPCWLRRDQLNFTDKNIVDDYKETSRKNEAITTNTKTGEQTVTTLYPRNEIDMEDFYETQHPHAIMRISTPYDDDSKYDGKEIFINRKGTVTANNLTYKGIRIWNASETPDVATTKALNGGYYFVDSLLLFNQSTKNALKTRMRFMCSTLSPDFINSGARGRMRQTLGDVPTTFACYSYKNGFCKNVKYSEQSLFVVRYQDKNWDIFNHDEINIRGIFDIVFRLPPVPETGTYEVRIFGNAQAAQNVQARRERGIIQFLIAEGDGVSFPENEAYEPCDIPVDMGRPTDDPLIGWVKDEDLRKKILDSDGTPTLDQYEQEQQLIIANDKAMRNRGYMKAPDCFKAGSTNLRDNSNVFRKIVVTQQMVAGKDYYLRLRQQRDEPGSIGQFNIIEIVPKDVYAGKTPEDRH